MAIVFRTPKDDLTQTGNLNDLIFPDGGDDTVSAGADVDLVSGGRSNGFIFGGSGVDSILAGNGSLRGYRQLRSGPEQRSVIFG